MARGDNLKEYIKKNGPWNKTPDLKFFCAYCNKEVIITKAKAKSNPKKRFCSRECVYGYKRRKMKCKVCNKEIIIPKSKFNKNTCSKKCSNKWKSIRAKESGTGKWMKGRDGLKHISIDGRKRISLASKRNFKNGLGRYIIENGSWYRGKKLSEPHKAKLRKAKESEVKFGRPWLRNGSYYPCCTCYKKLIYLNYGQMVRKQKPYCSRDCSPLKKHTCSDEVILDALVNKKMTMREIYKKHHCNPVAIKRILKNNNMNHDFKIRHNEILSELRKKDFKEGKFVFPLKDSSIEIKIQEFLKILDITFVTHKYIDIEHGYQCDAFIPSMNLIIEADGDYWHKYPEGRSIDRIRTRELQESGFIVLRLWEHEIRVLTVNDFKKRLIEINCL